MPARHRPTSAPKSSTGSSDRPTSRDAARPAGWDCRSVRFTEAELTVALTAVAKATLTAQSKDIRKGRVHVEDVWRDLGGYGRYQLLNSLGDQILPVLVSLPDVPRVHGQRPSYDAAQIRAA